MGEVKVKPTEAEKVELTPEALQGQIDLSFRVEYGRYLRGNGSYEQVISVALTLGSIADQFKGLNFDWHASEEKIKRDESERLPSEDF